MANHLTPEELAKEMGMDRDEVVRICIEEGVPIYHGKIDKTLFQASLEAVGAGASASQPVRAEHPSAQRGLAARGLLARAAGFFRRLREPLLRRGDARLERLHEVDHRRDLDRLRRGDLLAAHLRLEQRAQVAPVLARELRRARSRRRGSRSPARASSSSGFFTSVSSTASEISACE